MKIKEKKNLVTKTDVELKAMVDSVKKELMTMRLDFSQNKLKNTRSFANKRRDIAQILTVLRKKELAQ